MTSFFKRLFNRRGDRSDDNFSENGELRRAVKMRTSSEDAQTLKDFYDAFYRSTLLVALPQDRSDLVGTLTDRLRAGGNVTIGGISEQTIGMVWNVFTHEAALHRWDKTGTLFTPVPAVDVLWTAQRNRLMIAINPADSLARALLDHHEVQILSEGRYPLKANCTDALIGTHIQVLPLGGAPSEATKESIRCVLSTEPSISRAYVFKARRGYKGQILFLGLEFDRDLDQQAKNVVCGRVLDGGHALFRDTPDLVTISLWDEVMTEVTRHGVNVYKRERAAPPG